MRWILILTPLVVWQLIFGPSLLDVIDSNEAEIYFPIRGAQFAGTVKEFGPALMMSFALWVFTSKSLGQYIKKDIEEYEEKKRTEGDEDLK